VGPGLAFSTYPTTTPTCQLFGPELRPGSQLSGDPTGALTCQVSRPWLSHGTLGCGGLVITSTLLLRAYLHPSTLPPFTVGSPMVAGDHTLGPAGQSAGQMGVQSLALLPGTTSPTTLYRIYSVGRALSTGHSIDSSVVRHSPGDYPGILRVLPGKLRGRWVCNLWHTCTSGQDLQLCIEYILSPGHSQHVIL
jgi:hypothetical protein